MNIDECRLIDDVPWSYADGAGLYAENGDDCIYSFNTALVSTLTRGGGDMSDIWDLNGADGFQAKY